MANILDPTTGVGAKVNADGSLQVFAAGDGLNSYSVALNVSRTAAAPAAGALLWGMRAPATRTVVIRGGVFRLALDTAQATLAENAVVAVRFTGADPAGGTVQVAARKQTTIAAALTVAIRGGSGLTSTGITFDPDTAAIFRVAIPGNAGHFSEMDLTDLSGMELAPGEGLAMRASTALPIGLTGSGFIEFSER